MLFASHMGALNPGQQIIIAEYVTYCAGLVGIFSWLDLVVTSIAFVYAQ